MNGHGFGGGPIEFAADDVREGDAVGGAALGLLGLMTGLSEENWCAGWMLGLEYSLWIAAYSFDEAHPFGMGKLTKRQRDLLRMLSDECGGWWISADEDHSTRFVPLEDWRAHLAETMAENRS